MQALTDVKFLSLYRKAGERSRGFADALKNLFVENGAQIVSAEDADIVIKVK